MEACRKQQTNGRRGASAGGLNHTALVVANQGSYRSITERISFVGARGRTAMNGFMGSAKHETSDHLVVWMTRQGKSVGLR